MTAVLVALLAAAAPLSPAELAAVHAGVKRLSAEIVQTKTGQYWARPLESRVRLTWEPRRVAWETLEPVRSTVVIEGDRVRVDGPQGGRDLGAAAAGPRFQALVGFVRALVAFDLAGVEREFALTWHERELVAVPRAGRAEPLFDEVRLRFDDRLEIATIVLVTPAETTRLDFTRVERER